MLLELAIINDYALQQTVSDAIEHSKTVIDASFVSRFASYVSNACILNSWIKAIGNVLKSEFRHSIVGWPENSLLRLMKHALVPRRRQCSFLS
jgi:hypothetical protein